MKPLHSLFSTRAYSKNHAGAATAPDPSPMECSAVRDGTWTYGEAADGEVCWFWSDMHT